MASIKVEIRCLKHMFLVATQASERWCFVVVTIIYRFISLMLREGSLSCTKYRNSLHNIGSMFGTITRHRNCVVLQRVTHPRIEVGNHSLGSLGSYITWNERKLEMRKSHFLTLSALCNNPTFPRFTSLNSKCAAQ